MYRNGHTFEGAKVSRGKPPKSKSVMKFYTRNQNMWDHTINDIEKVQHRNNFEIIMFCDKESRKNEVLQTLELLKLHPLADTLIQETNGIFCAQIQDETIETIEAKLKVLGARNLGCINRIVMREKIQRDTKNQEGARLQLIKHIKQLASPNEFEILTNENLNQKPIKTIRKILKSVLKKHKPRKPPEKKGRQIRLSTVNLNQLGNNKTKIRDAIALTNADIICAQETGTKKNKRSKLPTLEGYRWITHNTKNGGTAILIDETTISDNKIQRIRHPNNFSCGVQLKIKNKSIRIINLYLPVYSGNRNIKRHKKSLDNLSKSISHNCIVMGDWNGWIADYNNGKSNSHGLHIETFAAEHQMKIEPIDKWERTRFDHRGNGTTVDYIATKNTTLTKIEISPDIQGTDHRALSVEILHTKKYKIKHKKKLVRKLHLLNDDDAGRHKYRDLLDEYFEEWKKDMEQTTDLESKATKFENIFIKAFDDTFGKKWINPSRNKQWVNQEWISQKQELKMLEKDCKQEDGTWKSKRLRDYYLYKRKMLNKKRKTLKSRILKKDVETMDAQFAARSNDWRDTYSKITENKKSQQKIAELNGKTADKDIANELAGFNEKLCGPPSNTIQPDDLELPNSEDTI